MKINAMALNIEIGYKCDRVQDDCKIQGPGVFPFVSDLLAKNTAVISVQFLNGINGSRFLSNKGTLFQQRQNINQVMSFGIFLHIREQLLFGDSLERVLDPVMVKFSWMKE